MAAFAPYLLAGGSAIASRMADRDLEERQKKIAQRMEDYQVGKARQGEQSIEQFIQAIDPKRRAAENSQIQAELEQGLQKGVEGAQALNRPDNFEGKVSENYTTRRAANDATTAERLKRAMQQLAVIGTPAERNLNTGFAFSDAAGGVDAANSAIRSSSSPYDRAFKSLRPDAFLTFASEAMGGASRAYANKNARSSL